MIDRSFGIKITIGLLVILVPISGYFVVNFFLQPKADTSFGLLEQPQISAASGIRAARISVLFKNEESPPKVASVFEIEGRSIEAAEAQKIAGSFGFSGKGSGQNSLVWTSGSKKISIRLSPLLIEYKDSSVRLDKTVSNREVVINTAVKFLQQKGLSKPDLEVDRKNVTPLAVDGGETALVEDIKKATILEVGFNRKFSGKAVFYPRPTDAPVVMQLSAAGQVASLVYRYWDVSSEIGSYPLLGVSSVKENLIKARGLLVYPQLGDVPFDAGLIKVILIEDIALALLDDEKSNYLTPAYVLRGTGFSGKQRTDVVIYLPAVREDWLKQ